MRVKLRNTELRTAGVFRCCIETVAVEHDPDDLVSIGDESACDHCGEAFRLVAGNAPIWTPLWQIEAS